MKYYTIENISGTFENKIRIYNNGIEEFCNTVPVNLTIGYCRCLEDLGYMSEHFLMAEQQARNFRDGLAESLGRW